MSSEALACSNWLRGPDSLRTAAFPFIPDTSVVDKLKRKKSTPSQSAKVECLVIYSNNSRDVIDLINIVLILSCYVLFVIFFVHYRNMRISARHTKTSSTSPSCTEQRRI